MGNRCTTGGANISITTQGRGITSGSALDNGDGTYLVTYEVKDKLGKYVNRDGKASTHSKLPVKRYKKGWLYYSMDTALPAHALAAKVRDVVAVVAVERITRMFKTLTPPTLPSSLRSLAYATPQNPPNFQRMWFEISAGTLACYGATDPNTSTSPDFPKHPPTFTLNLEECLIKLSKSNASFLTAPATDPACQWQILHPTHGTVNFCVDSKDFAYAWIVVCQDSCGKQEVKKVHSKSGKIHGEQQVNDDEIAINIAIDGNVLDCCPFTPKISSKNVLEKKLNRRASVEDLVQRNILQSKTSAIEFFETAGHSPEKQAEDAKKRMERKRQSIAGSFLNDEGKIKNMEQRKVELERVGGKQINVGAVSQGFLLKKGNYRHNWKKRFFVLSINLESADELGEKKIQKSEDKLFLTPPSPRRFSSLVRSRTQCAWFTSPSNLKTSKTGRNKRNTPKAPSSSTERTYKPPERPRTRTRRFSTILALRTRIRGLMILMRLRSRIGVIGWSLYRRASTRRLRGMEGLLRR